MTTLSVVIPVYNSEKSLPLLIQRLGPVLAANARSYEVLLVNDASSDRSWQVIQAIARSTRWVKGINLMRNYGQHNALLCGIRETKYEAIVTIDDDLQNPPKRYRNCLKGSSRGSMSCTGLRWRSSMDSGETWHRSSPRLHCRAQ